MSPAPCKGTARTTLTDSLRCARGHLQVGGLLAERPGQPVLRTNLFVPSTRRFTCPLLSSLTNGTPDQPEIRYRANIGPGDFDTRTREVIRHLQDGNRVRVAVHLRRRGVLDPVVGQNLLRRMAWLTEDIGQVERLGDMEGQSIEMVLVPRRSPPSPPDAGDREPRLPVGDGPGSVTAVSTESWRRAHDTRPERRG